MPSGEPPPLGMAEPPPHAASPEPLPSPQAVPAESPPPLDGLQLLDAMGEDRLDALLSRLLPHGQLLFLNHRFAQSLEKEVAAYMTK